MRYWEFVLTESQARKDFVTRQYKAALDALASSDQATSMGISSTEQLIDWFYNLDPSSNKKYFSWIVDRVVSKTATETLDSIQDVKNLLTRFEAALRTQQQAGISVLDSNIGKYRSLAALDAAIQHVSSSKEAGDLAEYNQARSESTMLHEDPTWAVAIPQTQQAAMYWTRGTTQCINWGDPKGLHPTRENHFDDDYLGTYVIHNKRDPKKIVSIHFRTGQIKDWDNEEIPREQWDNTNPFIRKVTDYHGKKLLAGSTNIYVLIGFARNYENNRWPELESKLVEHGSIDEIIAYAERCIQARWPDPDRSRVEHIIATTADINTVVEYAADYIKDRWPEPDRARVENTIIDNYDGWLIVKYAKLCIESRWPEPDRALVENMIIEGEDVRAIVHYAAECIKGRWPEAESKIIEDIDIDALIDYAENCVGGRWLEAESEIIERKDTLALVKYASEIIKGRWPEPDRARVENMIIERGNLREIFIYAASCIKGRWPEAEHVIFSQGTIPHQNQYHNLVQNSQGNRAQ